MHAYRSATLSPAQVAVDAALDAAYAVDIPKLGERIATAIEAQQFTVDLNILAVPDGIDPATARQAAATYFGMIASVCKQQAAHQARVTAGATP